MQQKLRIKKVKFKIDQVPRNAQTPATPEPQKITPKEESPRPQPIPRTPNNDDGQKLKRKAKDGQKLKRTLSYEQAFRAGKRQQKSVKERMLRKMLADRPLGTARIGTDAWWFPYCWS